MKKINNGGFSWSTLLGLTEEKRRISRKIGIPLTKSGRKYAAGNGNIWAMIINLLFK